LAAVVALATPPLPPTIITVKASPLCAALKNQIAPSVEGMMEQDQEIGQSRTLLEDMAKMQVMGGTNWFKMDTYRLGLRVEHVAGNWIRLNNVLDALGSVKIPDSVDAARVAALRERLKTVVDSQAVTLNDLSSINETLLLADIMDAGMNSMHGSLGKATVKPSADESQIMALAGTTPSPAVVGTPALHADSAHGNLSISSTYGGAAIDVGLQQIQTGQAESNVEQALQPIIEKCK
jgi:hypothetical protein